MRTTRTLGKSISLRILKWASLETMYSALPQMAQSTNLLSSGSDFIRLKKYVGETRMVFSPLTIVSTTVSANQRLVFDAKISVYSDKISVETHHSTLPSRKSLHICYNAR